MKSNVILEKWKHGNLSKSKKWYWY